MTPVHEGGTPLVGRLRPKDRGPPPAGPPLFAGDAKVVDAWHARARRDMRSGRLLALGLAGMGAFAATADAVPLGFGLALVATAAVLYPIAALATASRVAQRPFEVHEAGVWGTERRRGLRFRRFAYWSDITLGKAREVARGRFLLEVELAGGTVLTSIPGELNREAVDFVNEHTAFQVEFGP